MILTAGLFSFFRKADLSRWVSVLVVESRIRKVLTADRPPN